eukprot:c26463_g1_i1 orf=110-1942(+)
MGESGGNAGAGAAADAMDMDTDVAPKSLRFSFNLLQLIKAAQSQHGLRHGDYTRYRRYCTARLRRLFKSLKFTHGRGKYIRRQIVEATVTDVRFLHLVLYLAERAWSYAMEIKQSTPGAISCRRFHLMGRLSKAVKWADFLSRLCAEKADPRTSLEAAAYASYMKGSYLLEREENWENALRNFKSARAVYEELGKYGDVENQVLCRQRVEELEPSVRYCLYKMGHSNILGSEILDLEGPAFDLLQGKLEAVMAEARSQQAVTMTELQWLGHKFPINNAKARDCILKGQQLEADLLVMPTNPSSIDKKLAVYDKVFGAYQDAKRHVRDDLVMAGSAEDVKDELNGLDKAVSCILLQRTIDRNKLLVTHAKNRLNRHQSGGKEDKGEKIAKPEELVHLYSTLIQNVTDLSDLTTSGRERSIDEISFAMELDAKRLTFQAERCFYLAQSYSLAGKYAEAYVLFCRAREHVDLALESCQHLKSFDEEALQELKDLLDRCRAQCCLVHATGVAEAAKIQESLQRGVASISLKHESLSQKEKTGYLLDRLDKYEPAITIFGSKEPPRIAQLPPSFQVVPCKPIVLDTAINSIDFPSLEGRLRKEDKRKGLFSWWRS